MIAAEGREGSPREAALVSFGTRGVRCQRPQAQTGHGSTRGLRSLWQGNAPLALRLPPHDHRGNNPHLLRFGQHFGARKSLHTRRAVRVGSSEA